MLKNKKSRIRKVKRFLPAIVLATSFYYSFFFAFGILLGYLLCKAYCHVFGINEQADEGKIFLNLGKWKLHLHHWIMGLGFLGIVWLIDYFYLPTFLAGVVCGVIIQDIYDYNDWHQVLVKNPNYRKK